MKKKGRLSFDDIFKTSIGRKLKLILNDNSNALFLEMLFYYQKIIFDKDTFDVRDPFVMFLGNEKLFYPDLTEEQLKLINTVKHLMKRELTEDGINYLIKNYLNEPIGDRMFDIQRSTAKCFILKEGSYSNPQRKELYKKYLNSKSSFSQINANIPLLPEENKFNTAERYFKVGNDENKRKEFVKDYIKSDRHFYATDIKTPLDFPFTTLLEERKEEKEKLDDINDLLPNKEDFQSMGGSFPGRFNSISIFETKNGEVGNPVEFLSLDEVNHVVAQTGAGKSTIVSGIISSFSTSEIKPKILVLTGTTLQSIKDTSEYRHLGAKATFILGKNSKKSELNKYIHVKSNEYSNFSQFLLEEKANLEILDDTCHLKNMLNLSEQELKKKPCASLVDITKKGTSHICPAFRSCGEHEMYRQMLESDVWVMNYETFLKSTLPYMWDKFQRNFYTYCVEWADLIIFDEADLAQARFDSNYINTLGIVDDKPDPEKNSFFDFLTKIARKVSKSKTDIPFVQIYEKKVRDLDEKIRHLYGYILKEESVINFVGVDGNTFFTSKLLFEWMKEYLNPPPKDEEFVDFHLALNSDLSSFEKNKFSDLRITLEEIHKQLLIDKMSYTEDEAELIQKVNIEKKDAINKTLYEYMRNYNHQHGTSISFRNLTKGESYRTKKRVKNFEFLLMFYEIEFFISYLKNRYEDYIQIVQEDITTDLTSFQFARREPENRHAPAPLTDSFFAFSFNTKITKNKKDLKEYFLDIKEYRKTGRNFMYNIHRILDGLEETKRPKTLFLSATSYLEESLHFNVDINPNYLLTNNKQDDERITFNHLTLRHNHTTVGFSGLQDDESIRHNFNLAIKVLYEKHFLQDLLIEIKKEHESEKRKINKKYRDAQNKNLSEEEWNEIIKIKNEISSETTPCIAFIVKSYKKATFLGEALENVGFSKEKVRILKSPNDNSEKDERYITVTQFNELYKDQPEILILVRDAVSRGHNILRSKESQRSLIRKMFFFERPLPVPDNFEDMIKYLNGLQSVFEKQIKEKKLAFYEAYEFVKEKSDQFLERLITIEGGFSSLDKDLKIAIAANELVQIKQTIGRAERGGTKVDIYFLDKAMAPLTTLSPNATELDKEDVNSMYFLWKEIFKNPTELELKLFNPIILALTNLNVQTLQTHDNPFLL